MNSLVNGWLVISYSIRIGKALSGHPGHSLFYRWASWSLERVECLICSHPASMLENHQNLGLLPSTAVFSHHTMLPLLRRGLKALIELVLKMLASISLAMPRNTSSSVLLSQAKRYRKKTDLALKKFTFLNYLKMRSRTQMPRIESLLTVWSLTLLFSHLQKSPSFFNCFLWSHTMWFTKQKKSCDQISEAFVCVWKPLASFPHVNDHLIQPCC